SLIRRLEPSADPAAHGVAIAAEQLDEYRQWAQGVHRMAVKAEERIPEVLDRAGVRPLEQQPSALAAA
ncbi:MAG: methylenetetrahydrofolate reductase, partial [Synechococcaceae cyanobacterium]